MRKPTRIASTCLAAAIVIAGVGASSVAASAAPSNSGSGWRQTNANAALSRSNPSERVLTATTIKHARLLRTLQPQISAPVEDETCRYDGPDGYAQSPMFEPGGRLFVGTQNSVTEYDPSTGTARAQIALGSERNSYLSVAKGVLVADGIDCDSVSDPTGSAEAHDAITGQRLWSGEPAPDNFEGVASSLVVQDGSTLFAAYNDVSAIDVATGKTLWTQGNCWPYSGSIFVAGGHLIAQTCPADSNQVSALDEKTGQVLWTRKAPMIAIRADRSTPGGRAQAYVQRDNGRIAVLGANHGATLFGLHGALAVLAADPTRIYSGCGSDGTDICAYSKKNGALVWRAAETGDQVRQYPGGFIPLIAVGGNVVYVANGDALNATTGKSVHHLWTAGTATDLAVGDGYVAADLGDGALRLYGLAGN